MKTIHKYTLQPKVGEWQAIEMPLGAAILRVAQQFDHIRIWASVSTDSALEARRFMIIPTGASLPLGGIVYLSTIIVGKQQLVILVFEGLGAMPA